MKINCINGFFIFEELDVGEAGQFMRFTGLELVSSKYGLTFKQLEDAQDFSIKGLSYLGNESIKTHQGSPWDIFKENKLVYNFNTGLIVPIESITQSFKLSPIGNYFSTNGLIIPGSMNENGDKVLSYKAFNSPGSSRYHYSEVDYV